MSILFYRRPDYIAKVPGPMNLTQCQVYVERTQKHKRAIPPELSFENVIQNRALPVHPQFYTHHTSHSARVSIEKGVQKADGRTK